MYATGICVVSFVRFSKQYLYISSGHNMTVCLALTALVTADFTTPVHASDGYG
jgi:hypothetical protein